MFASTPAASLQPQSQKGSVVKKAPSSIGFDWHLHLLIWFVQYLRLYNVESSSLILELDSWAALLDCCFENESTSYSSGSDGFIQRYDLNAGTVDKVGRHEDFATSVVYSYEKGEVISTGLDEKIKFWDTRRRESLLLSTDAGAAVMHSGNNLVVCVEASMHIYDLPNLDQPFQSYKWRCQTNITHGFCFDPRRFASAAVAAGECGEKAPSAEVGDGNYVGLEEETKLSVPVRAYFFSTRTSEKDSKKIAKMNNSEIKIDSSSSGHSSPMALVTASNLRNDNLGDNNKKENCMDLERKKKRQRRGPTSPSQKQFMTLRLAHDSLKIGRQYLSVPFMRENAMTKLGPLTLVGKDGVKWQVNLRGESLGRLCLGKGWKQFAKENELETGKYFTLELVRENEVPMLRLVNTDSTSDRRQIGESSLSMEKESSSSETCNINQTNKGKNNEDERNSNISSLVQNRIVTLTLVSEDVEAGALFLPSQFVTAIGIKRLGKITLLGKDKMMWRGYLLTRGGIVDVGSGWGNYCEANGVKVGDLFRLEFINKEEDTGPVFHFCPNSRD